jgi:serine/threonine-protein phosphatase PGAM5
MYDKDSGLPGGGDLLHTGWEQAEYLARHLHQHENITSIYTSTMRRALTTAHLIASSLPHAPFKKDKMLVESLFYIPKGAEAFYGNVSTGALASHRVRVAYAYQRYTRPALEQDEHDLVVCHGNVIRYFLVRAKRQPIETWAQCEIYHASVTRLEIDEASQIKVVYQSNVDHLPERLQTVN